MAALTTLFCIVGDLVAPIAIRPQNLLRQPIQSPLRLLIRQFQTSGLKPSGKIRSLLQNQTVGGDMFRGRHKLRHPSQGGLVRGGSLPWQTTHQIHIDMGKACCHRPLIGCQKLPPGVDPSQSLQFPVPGGLQSQAQTVDPRLIIPCQRFAIHRARVGLQSGFGPGQHPITTP